MRGTCARFGGLRGAQAASLLSSTVCRARSEKRREGIEVSSGFAAGCRELQAGSLRSPKLALTLFAYAIFATSCTTPKDVQHRVIISVKEQKLALLDREKLVA